MSPQTAVERTWSERVVDHAAAALAGRGLTRRRFLYRVAVVGSALVVNPLQYVLRPISAYASVCGSGATCSSGWSVFCCTISGGANTCPEGSYAAGWWKVDASDFCRGAPRYYIDCNRLPGASCRCRCNDTGCDHRRTCCNVFRYGQCNTHIRGTTEVVCRVVTCTPPWEWDPACGRTVRTEPATRTHSAGCLPGPNPSHIDIKYQDMGMTASVLGRPVAPERHAARGGRARRYANGMILWEVRLGARVVHGPAAALYREMGAEKSPLGYPVEDQTALGGVGEVARFEGGSIYAVGTGAFAVVGAADRRYRALGGPRGALGPPTASTAPTADGTVTRFQAGAIYASPPTGAVEVTGAILAAYEQRGGPEVSGLGFPVHPAVGVSGGRVQPFESGVIAEVGGEAFVVGGALGARYLRLGGPQGPWGWPTASSQTVAGGSVATFAAVTAYWSEATGVHALDGAVLERYRALGGPGGTLGFPTSDAVTTLLGRRQASFEHGAVVVDPDGTVTVVPRLPTRDAASAPPPLPGTPRTPRDVSELP